MNWLRKLPADQIIEFVFIQIPVSFTTINRFDEKFKGNQNADFHSKCRYERINITLDENTALIINTDKT